MILRRLLTIAILLTSTIWSQAQQINAVPDYVFRNQMSVGRNAVTDTAAYFSIGPRYGATKGFMPPIVGDTATFSSGKRNGLLIFSVQKNKFLYWDSVRVQWSDMAGSSGAYIVAGDTASMLAPYLRKADTTAMLSPYLRKADTTTLSNRINLKLNISDTSSMLGNYVRHAGYGLTKSGQSFLVDTLNIATRAWRQKGLDSLAALEVSGSGTTNTVAKFTASGTIGNSTIFDNGTTISTSTPIQINPTSAGSSYQQFKYSGTDVALLGTDASISGGSASDFGIYTYGANNMDLWTNNARRLRIFANGRVGVNTTTDAGYQFDVNGTLRSVNGANFATSSGSVGVGTLSPAYKLDVAHPSSGEVFRGSYTGGTKSPFLAFQANDDALMYFAAANSDNTAIMGFKINGSEAGRFNSSREFLLRPSGGDYGDYKLQVEGNIYNTGSAVLAATSGNVGIGTATAGGKLTINSALGDHIQIQRSGQTDRAIVISAADQLVFGTWASPTQMALTSTGNLLVNTTTDAGYRLDVNGTLRSVNGANFATTSGNVGVGTASPLSKLHAFGAGGSTAVKLTLSNGGDVNALNDPMGVIDFYSDDASGGLQGTKGYLGVYNEFNGNWDGSGSRYDTYMAFGTSLDNSLSEKMRIKSDAELLINTTSDAGDYKLQVSGNVLATDVAGSYPRFVSQVGAKYWEMGYRSGTTNFEIREDGTTRFIIDNGGEVFINTDSDAGDYKLQVVGNARVGTGKLDIASNTTFGIGVARSGTSEVAGQIYNSSGILYLGAESSTGGQIFSGSSSYAAVIGSGANYPLQFAVNNSVRGGFNTGGELMINTTNDQGAYVIQANGSIYNTGQVTRGVINVQGTGAQIFVDSTTNLVPFSAIQSLSGSNSSALLSGNVTWNTTGNPSAIDVFVTNTASGSNANYINIGDGTNNFKVTKDAGIITANPTSGTAKKWKLGEAATVSPTSPNRTIRVEIDGTVYYLHAKTTND